LGGVCALFIRVGAEQLGKEENAVLSSQPTQTTSERQETQAPKIGDELFRELFDGLDDSILQEGDAPEEEREKSFTL
jgi:hypothetical protein